MLLHIRQILPTLWMQLIMPYLQAKYDATTLNPAVNTAITVKESRVTGYETADLSMVGGKVREVVFVGSSTIDYWSQSPENLVADMKDTGTNTEMSLVNRGMGGSVGTANLLFR